MVTPIFLPRRAVAAIGSFFFMCSSLCAQDVLWERSFGGKHAEYLFDAVPTADYGFILAGSSLSGKTGNKTGEGAGDFDYWIWKMDEKGEPVWQKSFGGTGNDFLKCINPTLDGGFILAGNSDSPKNETKKDDAKGRYDFWIIKINAGGGEEWQKNLGGMGEEKVQSISQTRDGGFIIGGSSSSDKSGDKTEDCFGNLDYWIIKLDKKGGFEWQKTYGGKYADEIRGLEQTADGGFIVGGYSNSPQSGNKFYDNNGIGDYWVLKLDNKGEIEWEKVIGGDKDEQLFAIHQTKDGGYILGGNSNSSISNNKSKGNTKGTDNWIVKLTRDGEIAWQETYDFGQCDILTSIIENKDNTFLVGSYTKELGSNQKTSKGMNDYIAFKISANGDLFWSKSVGSDGDDLLRKVIETRDGGYLLAGTSNPVIENDSKRRRDISNTTKMGSGMPTGTNPSEANEQLNAWKDEANKGMNEATQKINSLTKDSPVSASVNKPEATTGQNFAGQSIGNALDRINSSQPSLPASGDKKSNFGSSDFWVVKIKDKTKPLREKEKSLEAMPNPTDTSTNIIVNHDFQNGSATVTDLSGHILQQFEIQDKTVPVNLTDYPEGIYLVSIKTNVKTEGIKIIKKK